MRSPYWCLRLQQVKSKLIINARTKACLTTNYTTTIITLTIPIKSTAYPFIATALVLTLSACNSGSSKFLTSEPITSESDNALRKIISAKKLTGDALKDRIIPSITDAKPQLGMRLFFSKSLGGDQDSACVTCHHPTLGGGDNLSLSIGVGAKSPNLLGEGRRHADNAFHNDGGPPVPRNAPTTFNLAGWDNVLFHDGRVESLGKTVTANGDDAQGIRTPDSAFDNRDTLASTNLAAAQSRFPVTSPEEMKGFNHSEKDNQGIRTYLASRLGGFDNGAGELANTDYWLSQFQSAFDNANGTERELITEQNIALLIGEYERSQAFSDTPWRKFIEGDEQAITESAKRGALLFLRTASEGGANCASCHSGDLFSDEGFHNIAMPQVGRGKGNGADGSGDFGRFRESGVGEDLFAFRTPTLLNVEVTGPWSHAGAYTSLEAVVRHHLNPANAIAAYDFNQLTQPGIQNLGNMTTNTQAALDKLNVDRTAGLDVLQDTNLNDTQVTELVDFLKALTDPCVKDRACITKWIPEINEDPNGNQLDAINVNGDLL